MCRDFLTRSSALRAVALGAVAVPLCAASCVLADPPPELPNIQTSIPFILQGSVLPPAGQIFTNWPAGGLEVSVSVQVLDPTVMYAFLLIEDYGTPTSSALSLDNFGPSPDGGATEVVPVPPIGIPLDTNCHTLSLFVGFGLSLQPNTGKGYVFSAPSGYDFVNWIYDPSGDGTCASYDAAGLIDSGTGGSDSARPDAVVVPVAESGR